MISAHAAVPRPAVSHAAVEQAATVFAYSAVLLVLIVGPPLLAQDFVPYPLLRNGDIFDLVSALAALPIAWLLFREASSGRALGTGALVFMVIGAAWFMGQGMHLAANAIGHLVDTEQGNLARLVHDLDEVWSHYVWHAALIALSLLVIVEAMRLPAEPLHGRALALTGGAAILYGFTYFVMVVEGATAPMGVPAAVGIMAGGLFAAGRSLGGRPIVATFVLASAVSLVLFVAWAAMNDWQLIEFSAKGWI